ncbi:hypothetical protein ScPMuIL_008870 [Solemya velum]
MMRKSLIKFKKTSLGPTSWKRTYSVATRKEKFLSTAGNQRICLYSTTTSDPDFLHESIVPTDHFQKSLPRLPIPKLEDTCERYLRSQEVINSAEEFSQTKAAVQDFLSKDGPDLHKELVATDKQNKHTSYVSGPWFDMYLADRRPVVLNHNPFMVFTDDPQPGYMTQLIRATNMVVSSMRFMKTLRANILEPEVYHLDPKTSDTLKFRKFVRLLPKSVSFYGAYWYKAFPLDMSQYGNLFNSTRIPRKGRDEIFRNAEARHLLVLRNGHFYTFDVIDEHGDVVSPEKIMANLDHILKDNRPPSDYPLAVLTAEDRNRWADIREHLIKAGNSSALSAIDSAVFSLVLDNDMPDNPDDLSRSFLHGNGTNRWLDKCFELILNKKGQACVNFEHSWGDGVAVLRYMNEVYKDSSKNKYVHPDTVPANVDPNDVVHLEFKLDSNLKDAIREAESSFNSRVKSLDVAHLQYNTFTKKFVKEQKFSPDSVMQLVIQMAYYRQYGKFVGTYESCSTAAFKHGRTETVRAATMATKKVCEMILCNKTDASIDEIRAAIKECSSVHSQLTKEAALGQGFDRHLLALRNLSQEIGRTPAIFQDQAYAKINHNILSTSTLASPAVVIGGFGPVVKDGYGIGYAIEDDRIGFNITSYPPDTNVSGLIDCLAHSLDDLFEIFQGRQPKKMS